MYEWTCEVCGTEIADGELAYSDPSGEYCKACRDAMADDAYAEYMEEREALRGLYHAAVDHGIAQYL